MADAQSGRLQPQSLQKSLEEPEFSLESGSLLKASDLQARLGMSRAKVYRLMYDGILPTVRIGGSVRVPLRALEEWIGRNTRPGRSAA